MFLPELQKNQRKIHFLKPSNKCVNVHETEVEELFIPEIRTVNIVSSFRLFSVTTPSHQLTNSANRNEITYKEEDIQLKVDTVDDTRPFQTMIMIGVKHIH